LRLTCGAERTFIATTETNQRKAHCTITKQLKYIDNPPASAGEGEHAVTSITIFPDRSTKLLTGLIEAEILSGIRLAFIETNPLKVLATAAPLCKFENNFLVVHQLASLNRIERSRGHVN